MTYQIQQFTGSHFIHHSEADGLSDAIDDAFAASERMHAPMRVVDENEVEIINTEDYPAPQSRVRVSGYIGTLLSYEDYNDGNGVQSVVSFDHLGGICEPHSPNNVESAEAEL